MTGRPARALEALNFFLADVQAGVGPFVGVILLSRGWSADAIGSVMTLAGLAAMAATPLAGALVDTLRAKRALIVAAAAATALASLALRFADAYPAVAASQILAAVSGAVLAPAVAGVTLGIARPQGFDRQFGRNQMANHAGNVAGAALAGWLGWHAGFDAVFALVAVFTILAIASTLAIPGQAIDHACARGLDTAGAGPRTDVSHGDAFDAAPMPRTGGLRTLAANRPLLLLGASLALFHLGNAAMLPLYGMGVVATHRSNASAFTAQSVVIAQLVMVAAAWLAPRLIRAHGYWRVLLLSYLALPVRGALAAVLMSEAGVWPVQVLDGIGAGLQSVVVPALVVRLLHGSGRVNAGQGAVATAQGIGAALSPALGGMLAQHFGYPAAFVVLGAVSTGALALWLGHARSLSGVCGKPADLPAASS
ncbi:MFS transporter [Burkholderia stagnalis]|uniref:MFS transporter n=1 Tax=Burkholderia stagnalis TaxID=1503054 RepID=UPI000F581005|nr:MFS transporter [Burkholderia stagnalis]RQQ42697.1 MFS transporter [Burkholderia stagnalis]RQX88899.1 MFS transporter [Burkholderia stagnalis]RQY08423.1 MFS transporter [Burkholderia stagnalis]RQY23798.1 MFS transporter [Burkholderia stagnalis]